LGSRGKKTGPKRPSDQSNSKTLTGQEKKPDRLPIGHREDKGGLSGACWGGRRKVLPLYWTTRKISIKQKESEILFRGGGMKGVQGRGQACPGEKRILTRLQGWERVENKDEEKERPRKKE